MADETVQKKIDEKKNKIRSWLNNKYNLSFIGILLVSFIVRVYYFNMSRSQPLWWDELVFGALAKNFIHNSWNEILQFELSIRPLLFSFIWSILMRLNFDYISIKFLLEFVPSVLTVAFVYLVGKKMYGEKIALIASFIITFSWIHIFYSLRMLTTVPSLLFALISFYYFFKDDDKLTTRNFGLSIFFLSLAILIRYNFFIIAPAYMILLLINHKLSIFKNKSFWIGGILGIIPFILLLLYNLGLHGDLFPAAEIYAESGEEQPGLAWYTLNFFPHILGSVFLIFFILGTAYIIVECFLGFDLLKRKKELQYHLFLVLVLAINTFYLIFIRKYSEDRYLFETLFSMILIVSIALYKSYSLIKKYNAKVALVLVLLILAIGAYQQMKYGDYIIKGKLTSDSYLNDAFRWVKENVPEEAVLYGEGVFPYSLYHADKVPIKNSSYLAANNSVDFLVFHRFSKQSEDFIGYLNSPRGQNLSIVYASFFDAANKEPAILILKA